jgi:hypothetical protein
MNTFQSLLQTWVNQEPVASLWLAVTAVIFLGVVFAHSQDESSQMLSFGWRLTSSIARTIGLVGVLVMGCFLLRSAYDAFERVYGSFMIKGSLSNVGWQQWEDRYGDQIRQEDLRVTQYTSEEIEEAIPPADENHPTLYRHRTVEQPVTENSILRFRGQVHINLIAPVQKTDTFGAFKLFAQYEYNIVNPLTKETRAEFRFPLSANTEQFDDIRVKVGNDEITSFRIISETIAWDQSLMPGETLTVSIQYAATGMDWYIFEIPEPRDVTDFILALTIDSHNCCNFTDPSSGGIQLDIRDEPTNRVITWTINQAILAPRLSVNISQEWSYAPFHEMIVAIPYAPRGLILCFSLVLLTLLICRASVRIWQIGLLAFLFVLPYLFLMAGPLPAPDSVTPAQLAIYQVNMLPVLTLFSLALAFALMPHDTRFPRLFILLIMALFMAGYPRIGMLPDEQKRNVYEGIVQIVMLIYLFLLVLSFRVRYRKVSVMGQ